MTLLQLLAMQRELNSSNWASIRDRAVAAINAEPRFNGTFYARNIAAAESRNSVQIHLDMAVIHMRQRNRIGRHKV